MSLTIKVCTHVKKVFIVFMLYYKTLLLLMMWNTGKVKDRLRDSERVNSVIKDVTTEISNRCNI